MKKYVNGKKAYSLYLNETLKPYFVDKTDLIKELFPMVDAGGSICITGNWRLGKTVAANMIDAFFNKDIDSTQLFEKLKIGSENTYLRYINQYTVIHITMSEISWKCISYKDYISYIERRLKHELSNEFQNILFDESDNLKEILSKIYCKMAVVKIVLVMDDWDYIFHQEFVSEDEKKDYLHCLNVFLQEKPCSFLVYMTGRYPIRKYAFNGEFEFVSEYHVTEKNKFSEYYGFSGKEVDTLYSQYIQLQKDVVHVTREDLKVLNYGYYGANRNSLYNPCETVLVLSNNNINVQRVKKFSGEIFKDLDGQREEKQKTPNKDTVEAMQELENRGETFNGSTEAFLEMLFQ